MENGIRENSEKKDVKAGQEIPFGHLSVPKNNFELSEHYLGKWVNPYYIHIGKTDEDWVKFLKGKKKKIDKDIIRKNLYDTGWKARHTGAFFAAITNHPEFIDVIGTHLLRSEQAHVGSIYCCVLAAFNLPQSVEYLNLYLDYYLKHPSLWLDQRAAMEAILYLDKINATNHFEKHHKNWLDFVKDKPDWDKEIGTTRIESEIAVIREVQAA